MDVQDHTTNTTPLGHENHSVHLCPRCRWPFPNPHPSAKHRRSHKKVCGTIEGYTNLTGLDVVSDDEHHPNDDKEKSPSPKIEKKISIGGNVGGSGGIRASFSRSEEDLFSDAVTDFSDSGTSIGSVHKTLDRDLFFSFNDAENGGTNDVLNTPIKISKASLEVSNTLDTDVEKIVETEITKVELTETDSQRSNGSVKDEVVDPTPEQSYVSQSQEAESILVAGEEKVLESQTFETITEETKNSEISKTTPEVSAVIGEHDDNVKQDNFKKLESVTADEIVCERVSEVDKESETVEGVEGINEEIKVEKIDFVREIMSEVVKESEIVSLEGVSEEIKYAPEVAKESGIDQNILAVNEKEDIGAPKEQIVEVVKEPITVLSEIKDFEAPESENDPKEQIQEIAEIHTDEVVEKPDSLLTESQDLGVPILEKCLEEIVVEEPVPVLTESQDLIAPELEKGAKEISYEVIEQKVDDVNIVVADSDETVTKKDSSDTSVANDKTASGVTEPTVEETNSKLINNQYSGAAFSVDSGSRNSLEGNWGSVSVLSTASVDAESLQTTEKSTVNPENSIPSDTHSPPSFMTLVEPKGKDNKNASSDIRDLKQPLTKVNNESEVRNKNEEAIAKVTNWSATGKQSTPLKNLLGEAKSPSGKQMENMEKNEGNVVNEEANSPPKLIDDGKNGKKIKGKSSWMPFVCCSSVNVVN